METWSWQECMPHSVPMEDTQYLLQPPDTQKPTSMPIFYKLTGSLMTRVITMTQHATEALTQNVGFVDYVCGPKFKFRVCHVISHGLPFVMSQNKCTALPFLLRRNWFKSPSSCFYSCNATQATWPWGRPQPILTFSSVKNQVFIPNNTNVC